MSLTPDNSPLSRLKIRPPDSLRRQMRRLRSAQPGCWLLRVKSPAQTLHIAVACTRTLRPEVEGYVQAGIAPATKRAYRADLNHFEAWGGIIPATETLVTAYLADHAAVLKVSTLTRETCPRRSTGRRPGSGRDARGSGTREAQAKGEAEAGLSATRGLARSSRA